MLNWEEKGIQINGTKLNHLRFADDIVLMRDNSSDLQVIAEELYETSEKVGLSMNLEKTEVMSNAGMINIKVNEHEIQCVDSYKYLGQIISTKSNRMEEELNTRIKNA